MMSHIDDGLEAGDQQTIQVESTTASSIMPSFMQGGYTDLLLGLDQEASTARKLHFDEPTNETTFEE